MKRYDEADRIRRVQALRSEDRVAFALLCATRLLPQYRRFHEKTRRGDAGAVEELAERLWQHLTSTRMILEDLERAVDRCMELIPNEDEGWDEQSQPYAEDAAAALAYAHRAAVTGDAREAVWASRRAYEAMDHFAGKSTVGSSYEEKARIQHPAVQAELSRQLRDIAELGQIDESNRVQSLERLRHRAEQEGASAFPQ
jgi:uncharacterized protein YjaG (DUF416 family)